MTIERYRLTLTHEYFCNKEVWHALEEAPTIIEAEVEHGSN